MNKSELIARLADDAGLTKKDAEKFLDAFVGTVTDAMASGDRVQLVGFGTFEAKTRAAKTGVNPATGAKIEIKACKIPAFKAGKALKDEINK